MPQTPRGAFFILNMLQNVFAGKNYASKYIKIWCPETISEYTSDMKTFFKRLFLPFWGLTSLYLYNIQPYSNFHTPTKIFWMHFLVRDRVFFYTLSFETCWVHPCLILLINGLNYATLVCSCPYLRRKQTKR